MDKTTLGNRMKSYEKAVGTRLLPRTPVIIRVDGKAFHTFTKCITPDEDPSCEYGFSETLHEVMMNTAEYLCRNIQNVVVAYTQSDEISLVLRDWDTHATQQWFDGKLQKMASVSAGFATAAFNYHWNELFWINQNENALPVFDARVFNVPHSEVNNYMIWRQQDASRNSVQFIARKHFSHKSLHKLNNSKIQDKLMMEVGVNWNDIPTWQKRGACIRKEYTDNMRTVFTPDEEIPVFTQDRSYIEDSLNFGLGYE